VIDEQISVIRAVRAAGRNQPSGAASTLDIMNALVAQGHSAAHGTMLARALTAACSEGYIRRVHIGTQDRWQITAQGDNYLTMLLAFA
jgi:hypothetical protein